MKDVYYTLIVAAFIAVICVSYAIRVLLRGGVRSDRVGKVGGSALLGRGLVEMGYWAMTPVARGLSAAGATPAALSYASLALGAVSGVALAKGQFGLASLTAAASASLDTLDGQVARLTGTSSEAGEVLDAAIDRYTELFFLSGLLIFYRGSVPTMVLALAALSACFMISYSTAKAEAMHVDPPKGPMRRHERAVYLIIGAILSSAASPWLAPRFPHLPAVPMLMALFIVAVVGNASAVFRLWQIFCALRQKERGANASAALRSV